ncbi:MAG: hypothetical protein ACR2IT_03025, partial [Pirellulales bacterium]
MASDDIRSRTFAVGDSRIDGVSHAYAPKNPSSHPDGPVVAFVSVHDDEETAVEAAVEVLRDRGGRLVELRHTGARELAFHLGDTEHRVDPNRIFTPAG